MKNNWVWFVASRYIFKGRSSSPVLAVLGIAVGVLALIVIIAVMNGFQLSFIESIIEVSSYHLRLESVPENKSDELRENILSIPGIKAAIPFREFQALARGRRQNQQVAAVRGLPPNALEQDIEMKNNLDFEGGFFDISAPGSVLLGSELARRLGSGLGDEVTLYSITEILSSQDDGGFETFLITGIFRTGYYEYDCSWAFINIDTMSSFLEDSELKMGVKIANRFQDKQSLEQVKNKLSATPDYGKIVFSSWRDYNRSFFGALRTEKLFMFILVALIFVVVGLNIFQAQRRSVLQRREEIGLLRATGGTEWAVRFVFVLDGAIIGFTGAVVGLVFGLLIAFNIQGFFSTVESIINGFIDIINISAELFGAGATGNFAVFSPAIFYIKGIPSRVIPREVVLIFMFGFLSAMFAAWFASRKISKIRPAEVLRYE